MTDPTLTYVRSTLERATEDLDVVERIVRDRQPMSRVNQTAALWRLDMIRGALERCTDERSPKVEEIPANGSEAT